jgi:peptide deformylase
LRIFVIDLSMGRDPSALHVMINPEFVERDGMQLEEEGCLSVPGFVATVARPKRVVITGLNRAGEAHTIEGTGLMARALQHEVDHLNGCLFVDRLRGISRDLIVRKIKKLAKAGKW